MTPSSFQAYVEMTHLPHQQKARQAKSVESRLIKTQDKREQAIELRKGGMKQVEIAQMLDVNQSTIQRWLKSHQDEQI
jgi:DNA invertase Pin-like site-specific DNA recombinase